MHSIVFSDVLLHAALGTIFAGTGACVRGVCNHTFSEHAHKLAVLITALFILIEATVMVAVVG